MKRLFGLCILLTSAIAQAIPIGPTLVETSPATPTSSDSITISVSGVWSDSCTPGNPTVIINGYSIRILTNVQGEICLMVVSDWQENLDIGQLAPGTYSVNVAYDLGFPLASRTFVVRNNDVVCGDANGDGSVTIVDALTTARFAANLPTTIDPAGADVDGDAAVTVVDALMMARWLAGLPTPGTCL